MQLRFLPILALLALLAVPTAAAQVDVSAQAPTAAIDPTQNTTIPVTFSADCPTVLAEYDAAGNTELQIELKEAPAYITGVGDTVPFSFDMCDPASATVESTGNLVLTPGALAPGLEEFEIVVGPAGDESSTRIPITIAFRGTFALESAGPEFMLDHGSNGTGKFGINYTGNAAAMAMISVSVEPEHGTIEGLAETVDIPSPLELNETSTWIPLEFKYIANPGANFTMDMVSVSVMIHSVDDPNQMAEPQELMFHFMMMDHSMMGHEAEHDHTTHDHGANVPGFDAALVVVAALGVAFAYRRKKN